MAETKQIKARLKMKGKTSEHWAESNFVPIKNELVLVHDKGNIIVKDEDNDIPINNLVNNSENYYFPFSRGEGEGSAVLALSKQHIEQIVFSGNDLIPLDHSNEWEWHETIDNDFEISIGASTAEELPENLVGMTREEIIEYLSSIFSIQLGYNYYDYYTENIETLWTDLIPINIVNIYNNNNNFWFEFTFHAKFRTPENPDAGSIHSVQYKLYGKELIEAINNKAFGVNSLACGIGTEASADGQMAVGTYNEPLAEALFIVGNGETEENRKNALVVAKNGGIQTGGSIIESYSFHVDFMDGASGPQRDDGSYGLTSSDWGTTVHGTWYCGLHLVDSKTRIWIEENYQYATSFELSNIPYCSLTQVPGEPPYIDERAFHSASGGQIELITIENGSIVIKGSIDISRPDDFYEEEYQEGNTTCSITINLQKPECNVVGTNSTAFGYNCNASYSNSHLTGLGLTSSATNQVIVGKYNDTLPNNTVFAVGVGTTTQYRKNGLIVSKDGNGTFAGDVTAKGKKLATEEYVNDKFAGLSTETWIFTLADNSTVTKAVYVG